MKTFNKARIESLIIKYENQAKDYRQHADDCNPMDSNWFKAKA